jgi:hypothetical protein
VTSEENLEPKAIIRRAERLLAVGERIALKAEEADDSRLALLAVDRCQKSLDSLARIHGLIGPDSVTVVDQRSVNVYASWPTESLSALEAFHNALGAGSTVPEAIAAVQSGEKAPALPKPQDDDSAA